MRMLKLKLLSGGLLALFVIMTGCKKTVDAQPGNNGTVSTGQHYVDSKLAGIWLWTKGSDGAYYDNNGVYQGAASGLATQYTVNADGSGSCFSHFFSSIGVGSSLEINISSTGFFETDNQGHLGYFPLSGTYKSSSGEDRKLTASELYDEKTSSGKSYLYQKLTFTTQGGRQCFTTTATDGTIDSYFKVK